MPRTSTKTGAIRTPKIHVVFDSNALFTELADKLLALEISDLIVQSDASLGLDIHWHIPSIVKGERRRQMLTRGSNLLIPVAKLEALLGHKLGITEDTLQGRVDDAIHRQMELHKLSELSVDYSKIDWQSLVTASTMREPPFSPDNEKGFRDAIIAQTFYQLAERLPRTASSCRIILLTSDKLLCTAVKAACSSWSNVTVAQDADELRTLLNAVAAHLSQDVVQNIVDIAKAMMWDAEKPDNLWNKWGLGNRIFSEFKSRLEMPPGEGFKILRKDVRAIKTTFLEKTGQTVSFATDIPVESTFTKISLRAPVTQNALQTFAESLSITDQKGTLSNSTPSIFGMQPVNIKKSNMHYFRATWKAILTSRGKLTSPSLAALEFVRHEITEETVQ